MLRYLFDREERRTHRQLGLGVAIVILFFVSMFQSCSEVKHSLLGIETTAEIAAVEPSVHDESDRLLTYFVTDESGERVRVKRSVSASLGPFAPQQQIDVVYLSGKAERARLAAERNWVWPAIFLGMIGVGAAWVGFVWWQYARM